MFGMSRMLSDEELEVLRRIRRRHRPRKRIGYIRKIRVIKGRE